MKKSKKTILNIETRQLSRPINSKKFEIGNWKFTKCTYEVK